MPGWLARSRERAGLAGGWSRCIRIQDFSHHTAYGASCWSGTHSTPSGRGTTWPRPAATSTEYSNRTLTLPASERLFSAGRSISIDRPSRRCGLGSFEVTCWSRWRILSLTRIASSVGCSAISARRSPRRLRRFAYRRTLQLPESRPHQMTCARKTPIAQLYWRRCGQFSVRRRSYLGTASPSRRQQQQPKWWTPFEETRPRSRVGPQAPSSTFPISQMGARSTSSFSSRRQSKWHVLREGP
mmetsp:Transcript_40700/g.135606  ORF Transcript_40700/g.135606 Transcript_40700/m.135606 type:complete len:242 (-) Transcript_40700:137-862(-)